MLETRTRGALTGAVIGLIIGAVVGPTAVIIGQHTLTDTLILGATGALSGAVCGAILVPIFKRQRAQFP
jgi:membrane associated rhomboid family serine protease